MRGATRQLGFTLIELVITLVIATIVVSFASMFISGPVRGFADQARRSGHFDAAGVSRLCGSGCNRKHQGAAAHQKAGKPHRTGAALKTAARHLATTAMVTAPLSPPRGTITRLSW